MATKNLRKGVIGFVLTSVVLTGAGTGCAANDAAQGTQTVAEKEGGTETAGNAQGQEIVVWTQMMDNEAALLQEYANQWAAETGNTVSVISQQTDIQQFSQAANSKGGPDGMFGIPNDQLANYVSANLVEEIPDGVCQDSDFVDAAVLAGSVNGRKYGYPISVETPFLFYNTERIPEVPKTWEEMVELAKDNGGIVYEATSVYYNLGMLRAFDSYIFKETDGGYDTSDIGLGNANAVKAYTFVNQLSNEYGFFSSDITYDMAKSSFQNGEAAFYIGGAWDVAGFTETGTPFGVSDMPSLNGKDFVTPVGTYVGFVSAKSDAKEETFALYQYLVDNASVALYEEGGRIPAAHKAQELIDNASEATRAQIAQCEKGEPLPTVSEMGLIWQPFSDNMKLMFTGTISPEEAAGYIEQQVKESVEMMQSGQ